LGVFLDFPLSDPSFNKENNLGCELLLKMEVFNNGNIAVQNFQELEVFYHFDIWFPGEYFSFILILFLLDWACLL
jgi:hypothetical protein